MSKYRKKPVIIEARQWDGTVLQAHLLMDWMMGKTAVHLECEECTKEPGAHWLTIDTLEGTMIAATGDWIIEGVKGEFYPCKPDIFEMTYEKVDH